MYGKSVLALALLLGLIAARSIGHAFSRRGVDCTFKIAASSGNTCETFADSWGITTNVLKSINPDLDCAKFDDNAEYCVSGKANDDEPTNTTATPNAAETMAEATTSSSTEATETPTPTSSASDHEPTQPGLAENCDEFHMVVSGDQCDSIETELDLRKTHSPQNPTQPNPTEYKITHKQFIDWNPDVGSDCTNLEQDYNVCVHIPGATNTHGPTPQMPDLSPDCKTYHQVSDGESCPAIQKEAGGITLVQFREWNPTIDAKCTNLWSGYYVCIGV
ncbi:hypothetical protein PITC_014640 [Penicillium italicum]|uniref:LysM domain-containing protein n=1 Tax=Penicillium italicum TaxID=40296 RepID=A0A0A2KRR3_PENIT|nr:hypothetical protein PITC_014640 [Penicillium italicum]